MEPLKEDKARIFDHFYSNDTLTMLKIFSFFMDDKQRPILAVLIKYMELNICLQKSMKHHCFPFCNCNCKKEFNLEDILCELGDYLPEEYKGMMDQIKNMKENMEMYSQMMEMMNMMQENSPTDSCE